MGGCRRIGSVDAVEAWPQRQLDCCLSEHPHPDCLLDNHQQQQHRLATDRVQDDTGLTCPVTNHTYRYSKGSVIDGVWQVSKTRSPAVARTAERTGCQWPSRSSKINACYVIWKPICNLLLVINSNLRRFRDTATYSLKLPLKIAAKALQMTWLLLTACRKSLAPYSRALSPNPYATYRLATIHPWQIDGRRTTNGRQPCQ